MIEHEFQLAMADAGLEVNEPIIADGRPHRFHVKGDRPSSRNGWYVLFSDGVPSGSFGSWKTGFKGKWCAKMQQQLTATERAEQKRRVEAAMKARKAEDSATKQAAQEKALAIWRDSPPASDDHHYLVKKGVKNHGLRLSRGALVAPLHDSTGEIHSLQFIDGEGNKRFLSGGRKRGCYFSIGQPADMICIAEGFATAASVHEATGHAVAVAFDAGNLLSVAQALRQKFPTIKILLCADNDTQTPGNPGLTYARQAAAVVGGFVVFPKEIPHE